MTTPQAAASYLADHLRSVQGHPVAIFNPHNKDVNDLPVIYGFNNGGSPSWLHAVAIAQDGHALGSHICSDEGYMPSDLGILDGTRNDRHEKEYQPHYPNGYRMEWVPSTDIDGHAGLNSALAANKAIADAAEAVKAVA
jgi:hypothetical protein